MLDFLHPDKPLSPRLQVARRAVNRATKQVASWMT
jgi:hypothetical protein